MTGTVSARPSAGWNGRLFLPSNGYTLQRDSGTVWAPWGPLFPLVDPTTPSFAWTNQGTATETVNGATLFINAPNTSGDQLRILDIAVPAAPYTATLGFIPAGCFLNFQLCGMSLRDSSGGGVVTWALATNTGQGGTGANVEQILIPSKWTNVTTFSASYTTAPAAITAPPFQAGPMMWLRIKDDNTNRSFQASNDGQNFLTLFSVGRTDFITPNRVGLVLNGNSSTAQAVAMTVMSWSTTQP